MLGSTHPLETSMTLTPLAVMIYAPIKDMVHRMGIHAVLSRINHKIYSSYLYMDFFLPFVLFFVHGSVT